MNTFRPIAILLTLSACGTTDEQSSVDPSGPVGHPFAIAIAKAHGEGTIAARAPVHADVHVEFHGQPLLAGKMVYDPADESCRIDGEDGKVMVFDGDTAWAVGVGARDLPRVQFDLRAYPFLLAVPWQLTADGATVEDARPRVLRDAQPQPSAQLTLAARPDRRYFVYTDARDNSVAAFAYRATYGTSPEDSEPEPHVAVYDSFEIVDGLRLPTRLTIYPWDERRGIVGAAIGTVTFSDFRFAPAPEGAFAKPDGAVEAGSA